MKKHLVPNIMFANPSNPTSYYHLYDGPPIYEIEERRVYDTIIYTLKRTDLARYSNNIPLFHRPWSPIDVSTYYPGHGSIALIEISGDIMRLWVPKNMPSNLIMINGSQCCLSSFIRIHALADMPPRWAISYNC